MRGCISSFTVMRCPQRWRLKVKNVYVTFLWSGTCIYCCVAIDSFARNCRNYHLNLVFNYFVTLLFLFFVNVACIKTEHIFFLSWMSHSHKVCCRDMLYLLCNGFLVLWQHFYDMLQRNQHYCMGTVQTI